MDTQQTHHNSHRPLSFEFSQKNSLYARFPVVSGRQAVAITWPLKLMVCVMLILQAALAMSINNPLVVPHIKPLRLRHHHHIHKHHNHHHSQHLDKDIGHILEDTNRFASHQSNSSELKSKMSIQQESKEESTVEESFLPPEISTSILPEDLLENEEDCAFKIQDLSSAQLFAAISTDAPSSIFARKTHPLTPLSGGGTTPLETNKFYSNLYVGTHNAPAYTQPFSVWWSKTGMAVSHSSKDDWTTGPDDETNKEYVFAPTGIKSLILGATAFDSGKTTLEVERPRHLSSIAVVRPSSGTGRMDVPLVQGMGMVTAGYQGLTPKITSGVGFKSVAQVTSPRSDLVKHRIVLADSTVWVMYVRTPSTSSQDNCTTTTVSMEDNFTLSAVTNSTAVYVQIAPVIDGYESYLDKAAGQYVVAADITGSVYNSGNTATYSIVYTTNGTSNAGEPLVYLAPHHVASLSSDTASKSTPITSYSVSLGKLTAYLTSTIKMTETLPTNIGFMPWSQVADRTGKGLTSNIKTQLQTTATSELNEDVSSLTNLESTYSSGKALDKFAQIIFVAKYVLENDTLAASGAKKLKAAFDVFFNNKQQSPLVYETTWRGVVTSLGLGDDPDADYGSSYYNDHHFHYGYFVHAAAVLAKSDSTFLTTATKTYINTLIRDVANPSSSDPYFPAFRSFDWYHGHSWAKGLFETYDGKDQESSSEDYHFIYGMKLWGQVTGDSAMEARANLMLAICKRSVNTYILYGSTTQAEAAGISSAMLPNKVSGITFENKIAYTTYFGTKTQYIHGIHMIPVTSVSSYVRTPSYVAEEWTAKIASIISSVDDNWKGILMMNRALTSPSESLAFFNSSSFQSKWLDDGMSLTWALAYAALTV